MSDPKWDFGPLTWIDADALGEPGQRTFRLRMQLADATGTIWREKEQLQMLGIDVEQLLAQLPEHMARGGAPNELLPGAPVEFPDEPTVEFRANRLALGYDEATDMFAIIAHEAEIPDAETEAELADLEALAAEAAGAEAESES